MLTLRPIGERSLASQRRRGFSGRVSGRGGSARWRERRSVTVHGGAASKGEQLTWLDRRLQRARIAKAARFIEVGERVLDVGCADGSLFVQLPYIREGLGIDPEASDGEVRGIPLRRGHFPADLAADAPFDVLCALAVFEHVPEGEQAAFVGGCRQASRAGGRAVLTVPAPLVDHLIGALKALRLLHGMETHEHWGFSPAMTSGLFAERGFTLLTHRRFELGLNHLFVFRAE